MVESWLRHDGLDAARADPAVAGRAGEPAARRGRRPGGRGPGRRDRGVADAARARRLRPRAARRPHGGVRPRARRRRRRLASAARRPAARSRAPDRCRSCGGSARVTVGAGSFPVGVPLLDESHLQIDPLSRTARTEAERVARRAAAESLVETLLLRAVGYFRPGLVHVHTWDVGHLTGSLPGLYPLTRTGLLTVHDPGGLEGLLEELSDRIRRVHARVLVGGHPSLKALARADRRALRAVGGRGPGRRRLAAGGGGPGPAGAARRPGRRDLRDPGGHSHDHRGSVGDGPPADGGHRGRAGDRRDDVDDRPARDRDAGSAAAAHGRDGRLPRDRPRARAVAQPRRDLRRSCCLRRRSGARRIRGPGSARRSASSRAFRGR